METADESGYLATGFREIDENPDFDKFLECLNFMDGLKSFQDYKQELLRRVQVFSNAQVLDVGCGVGHDVRKIAERLGPGGKSVGVDSSSSFVKAAKAWASQLPSVAEVNFIQGKGESLDFPDRTFDICRVDRTLQHVSDPTSVIREMSRVLKPGGYIACAEPDWGTFVITSDDRAITRRVVEAWCDGFRNGWVGRTLAQSLLRENFEDVEVSGHLLLAEGWRAIDTVYDVALTAKRLNSQGVTELTATTRWLDDIMQQEYPMASVTLFLATARKSL